MPIQQDADKLKEHGDGSEKEHEARNLPKPNNALFDSNSPIYKRDNPAQEGEAGKAVKIDKHVSHLGSLIIISYA
jgi:hypothetical protein